MLKIQEMELKMTTSIVHVIAFLLGVSIHQGLFIHGEWHLQAPTILICHLAACFLFSVLQALFGTGRLSPEMVGRIAPVLAYLSGLFLSIGTYRLIFHRLRAFQGPRLAALTKLWHVWKCRDSRNHHLLESLYRQYGTFVRTG